jgi:tRNA dimethylallyltransferase
MTQKLPKIIVVLGPTASGKTDVGIFLAREFNGEIVNADSRQVYKEMNIATAKPQGANIDGVYNVDGIPHHLMDIIKPSEDFTLSHFKIEANKAIKEILSRGKLPIIVGGTGLYISTLVDNFDIPKVAPNKKLRKGLEEKTLEELVILLKKIDEQSAKAIDLKNRRRVLRALEVAITNGESFVSQKTKSSPLYDSLQIGLEWPREELYERINKRVDIQMSDGLLEEAKHLAKKYPWSLPSMSSIGYKQLGGFLRGERDLAESIEQIKKDTRNYAKRQMTWFKRDERIKWVKKNDSQTAAHIVREFIK